jgi:FemAB-related protein (PEP-CTERM system-associated)
MNNTLEIRYITHENDAWDTYVEANEEATIYHLSAWKRIIKHTFGHQMYYLAAWQHERIVGVLPLTFLKSLVFGRFLISLPFLNYAGILAEHDDARKRLLEEAVHIAKQVRASHIELRHLENYALNLPVKTSKVLMVLELPDTSEELWKRFKSKLRSQIRRPTKEGFSAKIGYLDELESFYEVFVQNMRDLGTPVYTKRFFKNILREFPETARICTVYDGQMPIASGFLLGYRTWLQIPWASSVKAYNRSSPNMLLYWSILEFACNEGYAYFDFGRSTPGEGTYKFKQQWGAQPVQCYWHYWLASGGDLPEINPHNPKYRLMINTWQRLPLTVTRWIGPHIVKNLP